MAVYPQPQVQKRGPPPTSHPFENPAKKQSKWSAEENALITELRGNGMKWEDISKRLPGRSAISCRLHYQNFLERKAEWDEEKKNKLARLYDRFKKDMWDPVAKELGMPWRAVEAMHWELGNDGIAARTGVPVFATASATATEPPSMSSTFATAPVLAPALSYSPPSPPQPGPDNLHGYPRLQGHGAPLQPMPISSLPPHVHPYSNFPPPPQIPQEPPRARQRRSASTAPSSSRPRSTSRKRTLSGANMDSRSPIRAGGRQPSMRTVPSLMSSSNHQHAPNLDRQPSTDSEKLPPMRYLTEPPLHEQQLMPVPYGRPTEPRGVTPAPYPEHGVAHTARPDTGGNGGESPHGGGGGENR